MKTILKSYKFRIYPTSTQQTLLAKHFGCCRLVYNLFLAERKKKYEEERITLSYFDSCKLMTQLKKDEDHLWLNEVNSQSLQASLKNMDEAYRRFFKKQNKFPTFKSKFDRQAFKAPQQVSVEGGKLYIPKFREGIPIKLSREMEGKVLFATISKSTTCKYYVAITCEVQHQPYEKTGRSVGVDTGIKELAILSDGKSYENIGSLKTKNKQLRYEQRKLARKQKGSRSRQKQRRKLALVHEKIANCRRDYLHKVTTEIVKNHDMLSIEDLAVKNIMKNHHLAQAMSDVSLGAFYTMLQYKADWNDRTIIKIDRFYPSSKTCSCCGWINKDLTLSDRIWTCPSCHTTHDRDVNAAKNILQQGLIIQSGCGSHSDLKQKRAEALPLGKSVNPGALTMATA